MLRLAKMTIGALGSAAAARYEKRRAFGLYGAGALYDTMSYGEFGRKFRQFAALFMDLGIRPGGRVLLLSENRPEWPAAYFGIALAGAVSAPLLTEFSAAQVQSIAAHAGVSACCVTEKTASKVREGRNGPFDIPLIYLDSMETRAGAGGGRVDSIMTERRGIRERLYLRDGDEDGDGREASGGGAFPVFPDAGEQDMASIIYTSGTTGDSKGVMLSHYNLLYTASAARSIFKIYPRDRFLSIVPLAHTYECTMGMLIAVLSGASTAYLDRLPAPAALFPAAKALRPTVMLTVPLIIEKVYRNRILPALKANSLYRHPLTRSPALQREGRRLRSLFGGAIRLFSIGGAPLAEDTEAFLRQVRFPYTLGYGMTEASPLLAGTSPFKFPPHSVGRTIPGVELRIVDGEIQARGPNIMMGYFRDEGRSAQSFNPGGWFKTGDLGFFDEKGYLYIKGRIKALILGPSGENIYPEEIERLLLGASDMVEDALVYPGNKGELVALVVLSEKARTMLTAIGDRLGELRNAVNKGLATFSRISRIEVRTEPFEKTATAKTKRFLYGRE
jgi:long-chain acyl-CoA synthetase